MVWPSTPCGTSGRYGDRGTRNFLYTQYSTMFQSCKRTHSETEGTELKGMREASNVEEVLRLESSQMCEQRPAYGMSVG